MIFLTLFLHNVKNLKGLTSAQYTYSCLIRNLFSYCILVVFTKKQSNVYIIKQHSDNRTLVKLLSSSNTITSSFPQLAQSPQGVHVHGVDVLGEALLSLGVHHGEPRPQHAPLQVPLGPRVAAVRVVKVFLVGLQRVLLDAQHASLPQPPLAALEEGHQVVVL